MIWQRLKNLWYLSEVPKGGKGYPDEYERGFQAGEMHAIGMKRVASSKGLNHIGGFIPRVKQDPIKKIVESE